MKSSYQLVAKLSAVANIMSTFSSMSTSAKGTTSTSFELTSSTARVKSIKSVTTLILHPTCCFPNQMGTLSCQSLTRQDNENKKKRAICDRLSTVILCQVIADKESMEEDLQRYISLNTYLDSEDPWFWQKLRYSLMCIFHRTVCDHCKIFSEDNHCYKM